MKELYNLTNPQKSIWVTEEFYKGTSIENIVGIARFSEIVNFEKLKEAINIFVKTNDSFRLKFIRENNEVKQFIYDFAPFSFEIVNVKNDKDVKKLEEEFAKTPLEVFDSYLFRSKLFTFEDGHGGFLLCMHHLIVDAWAAGLVISKIIDIYDALLEGTFSLENFASPSYVDYIESEQKYMQSAKFEKDKEFWNSLFKVVPETATIPSTLQTNDISSKAKRKLFKIPSETMDFINSFCKENKISPYNFFMGIYSIYLSRVSNLDEFVIGTPILNRSNVKEKHTVGMFISVVPFKVTLDHEKSFAEFSSKISADFFNIFRHQKYPYQTLLEDLRKTNNNIPNLYNIMISYQNMRTNKQSAKTGYESSWVFNGNISDDMEIHFFDINDTGTISIAYDYKTSKFTSEDIYALHSRILHMINQVIENNNILLKEMEIVTPDEKNKILNEFNNTKMDYPKDKTIVQLFEEQVEKTPDNIAVVFEDQKLTYRELNEKANSLAFYLKNNGLKSNDVVSIFLDKSLESIIAILGTLKCGATYMPIDINYPNKRIDFMINDSNSKFILTSCQLQHKLNNAFNVICIDLSNGEIYNNFVDNISTTANSDSLAYIMYTSGSTGTPKGVMVSNKNVVRLVKNANYIKFNKNERILQTGSIVFDACTFEIWGVLLNGFELYIIKKQDLLDPISLEKYLVNNKITILWLTAPLFNQLCESNPSMFKTVRVLLTGGDVLSQRHINAVKKSCPNLTIINGYGPTENTTFSTCFTIDNFYENSIPIGFPISNSTCYIVSPTLNLLPVGVSGELLVGGDGVSKGYLNNPKFTTEKFIDNPFGQGTLYKTGDLAKWRTDGSIDFIGRIDNQVKIRGFRVELNEITLKIQEFPNIKECFTTIKTINDEKVICSYFSSSNKIDMSSLKNSLRSSLPHYAIPSYFIELDALPINTNGKVDVKKLPEPQNLNSKTDIILPRNKVDNKLIDLLKVLLNINNISIDDNFFDLGGDSLSAINLCAQIQNEFSVQLFVKDVLEHPIIQEISDIITNNLNNVNKTTIKPIPKADYYMASSAQKRMYFASSMAGEASTLYNIPGGIILDGEIDANKLEKCFNKLIERHETLRTYFAFENDNVVQKIIDKISFKLEIAENCDFNNLDTIFKDFVKPFDLAKAPLFRAKFIKFGGQKSALFVDIHHIISDGTSLSIFIDELCKLYNDEVLPELNITYKDFSTFENDRLASGSLEEAEQYWVSQFADDIPVLNLPTNYSRPATQSFEGAKVYSSIDLETTNKINTLAKNLGVTPYMILLSVYYILLEKYTSCDDIVVGSPIVGRDISETYNLIGMFVNSLALRTKIDSKLSFNELLETVKANCLNAYKYQAYPFDELVNKLDIKRDTSRNPLFDTMFTYQNNGLKNIEFNDVKSEYYIPDTNISKFDLSLELIPNDDGISVSFEYATKLFDGDFIKNLSNHYLNILNAILDNEEIKVADIDMLSESERNKILNEFNNTSLDYPKDATIVQLFEKQVEQNPDGIAVVFEDEKLTYRELNAKANSIAHFLKQNDIGKNDIVPVLMNRSLDLIISMMGIIKAGAAYLPISAEIPTERVDFILTNSNAKTIFVKSSQNLVYNDTVKIVDLEQFDYSKYNTKNLNADIKPVDLLYVIYTSGSTGNPKGVKICHHNLVNFVKSFTNLYGEISEQDRLLASTNISFDVSIFEYFITLLNGATLYLYNETNISDIFKYCKTIIKNKITFLYIPPNILEDVYNILSSYTNIPINKLLLGVEPIKSSTIKKYYTLNPNLKIINAYGPTECTICSTAILLDSNVLKAYKIIPIGRPLHNLRIFILDKNKQPVPVGVPGEIYISGDNIARGYLNNRELTDKNFISIPNLDCKLAYKTGDLAKWNNDGLISFIGRNDYQVKINGHRIELGEIEACVYLYPNIDKALVQLDKNNKLICYFSSSKQININDLKAFMQRKLPLYFIPNFFVQVESFKLTANGKIDRKALSKIKVDTRKYL
ncbi:MAG: amino acid adenylation domain-containing protein [Clostridia bacterium]|nr:amino acid adenylation domain-containing protein [Clostridia bacterium]